MEEKSEGDEGMATQGPQGHESCGHPRTTGRATRVLSFLHLNHFYGKDNQFIPGDLEKWNHNTFKNNFRKKHTFKRYLKKSSRWDSVQHFPLIIYLRMTEKI